MPREFITIECVESREAKRKGEEVKGVSRYITTKNKKTMTDKVEKMKFNPFLKKHTLHREIKK